MNDAPNLEIEGIWEYYDAPISGPARLGDMRLYYTWSDEMSVEHEGIAYKRRLYTAYTLTDDEWKLLEDDHEIEMSVDADATPTPDELAAQEARWGKIRALHDALETRPGVIGFTSASPLRWPRADEW